MVWDPETLTHTVCSGVFGGGLKVRMLRKKNNRQWKYCQRQWPLRHNAIYYVIYKSIETWKVTSCYLHFKHPYNYICTIELQKAQYSTFQAPGSCAAAIWLRLLDRVEQCRYLPRTILSQNLTTQEARGFRFIKSRHEKKYIVHHLDITNCKTNTFIAVPWRFVSRVYF